METLIITYTFNHGVPIGIYNGNAKLLVEDMQILKPTALCVVSKIFQLILIKLNPRWNYYLL